MIADGQVFARPYIFRAEDGNLCLLKQNFPLVRMLLGISEMITLIKEENLGRKKILKWGPGMLTYSFLYQD